MAACKQPHFRSELFANIYSLRPKLNENEPTIFANLAHDSPYLQIKKTGYSNEKQTLEIDKFMVSLLAAFGHYDKCLFMHSNLLVNGY